MNELPIHVAEVTSGGTHADPSRAPAGGPAPADRARWRDLWPWDSRVIFLVLVATPAAVGALVLAAMPRWGLGALWLLGLEGVGLVYAAAYGLIGRRVRALKAGVGAAPGDVADGLVYSGATQSPALFVLRDDRLDVAPVVGGPWAVPLREVEAVRRTRWFNGSLLLWKKGYVLELKEGRRVALAVAGPVAARWRGRLGLPAEPARDGRWG